MDFKRVLFFNPQNPPRPPHGSHISGSGSNTKVIVFVFFSEKYLGIPVGRQHHTGIPINTFQKVEARKYATVFSQIRNIPAGKSAFFRKFPFESQLRRQPLMRDISIKKAQS